MFYEMYNYDKIVIKNSNKNCEIHYFALHYSNEIHNFQEAKLTC